MRKATLAALFVLCGTVASSARADYYNIYSVTLTNGTVFETRQQPTQASWDPSMLELLSETGNWIALPKSVVQSVASIAEARGYGRVINTTTIDLGFAPNDVAEADRAAGRQLSPMEEAFESRAYDQKQFVEPEAAGGGFPIMGGFTGGGGGGGDTSTPPPASAPQSAPAAQPSSQPQQ
jgi:hypothetical protein